MYKSNDDSTDKNQTYFSVKNLNSYHKCEM
jgi:hypothetical protein